jgi:hypothetical protein
MLPIGRVFVGLLLLVLGRRLYWLFVAGMGFLYGLELAPRLLPGRSETVIVIVALALALVGALVAVVATKIALGMIGFAAGGGIAVLLLGNLGIDSGAVALAVFVIGGLLGAVLLLVLFDWTLIALSSLAGGSLIVTSAQRLLEIPPIAATALVLVLAVAGALIQARLWPARRPSR